MTDPLPDGLIPAHSTPVFTQDTLPKALQQEHALAPGHWARLHVLEGRLVFANLETGRQRTIAAPEIVAIPPALRHRVEPQGAVRARIEFFRE